MGDYSHTIFFFLKKHFRSCFLSILPQILYLFLILERIVNLVLFVLRSNSNMLYQCQCFLSMVQRGHGGRDCFRDIGDVHKRKEAMQDEQLTVHLQHMKEQCAVQF
jgi:hypothetical protein